MKADRFKVLSLTLPITWVCLFFIFPIGLIIGMSVLTPNAQMLVQWPVTLLNYRALFNPIYGRIFIKSVLMAGSVTLMCLCLAYPFAYWVARSQPRTKSIMMLLLIIPFWTSSLIRTYAIMAILKSHGLLNHLLLMLGIVDTPLSLLYTNVAVLIGLVYNLLPFMIFPLIVNIERMDDALIQSAYDLGASHWQALSRIIMPMSKPGIVAGSILVFFPAMTLFYIPDLLGGAKSMLLGNLIQNQFIFSRNWPLGASMSVALTLIMLAFAALYWRQTTQKNRGAFL